MPGPTGLGLALNSAQQQQAPAPSGGQLFSAAQGNPYGNIGGQSSASILGAHNNSPLGVVNQIQNQVKQAQSQAAFGQQMANANNQTNQISALLKSIQAMDQANAPGVAPTLNLNAINSQAQSAAGNSVNPLYTQYLNQYLQQESANQQAAQSQNTLNINQEQGALGNILSQNQLATTAAGKQNSLTQGNINAQQQNYQLASGNAQNQKMSAIQSSIGTGNLGASGLGQQQVYEAENARNVADAAQNNSFQYQRDTNNLSTQDTFAQLAQSSQYATTAEGQQEAQTNFNLNDYLRQAAYNDSQYRQALEASRQQALTATTQQQQAQIIQQQLSALNPAGSKNYAAGEQAYGNLLNPSISLPGAPSQNDYLAQVGSAI